jgi:hypothetical protein
MIKLKDLVRSQLNCTCVQRHVRVSLISMSMESGESACCFGFLGKLWGLGRSNLDSPLQLTIPLLMSHRGDSGINQINMIWSSGEHACIMIGILQGPSCQIWPVALPTPTHTSTTIHAPCRGTRRRPSMHWRLRRSTSRRCKHPTFCRADDTCAVSLPLA